MKEHKRLGLLITILLSIIVLYLHYRPYVTDPNHNFFNLYGDGYKNYFTVYYHIKHDATYSHFEGMNYPYGEHIMYTDGQPALSNTLKFFSKNIVDVSAYTVGIMNIAIVLSFLFCAVFLYLTLVRLHIAPWFAVLAALGIMLMSPQHFRAISHYPLSYGFILPLIFYLLLRFENKPSFVISICIALTTGIAGLLHMYYVAIIGMFIGWYFLFTFLKNRTWQEALRLSMHFGVQVILPFLLIQIWVLSTDMITDRPKTPLGFFDYRARVEGILTNTQLPYWAWFDKNIIDIREMSFENVIYIGIVGIIGFLFFLIPLIRKRILPTEDEAAARYLNQLFPSIIMMLLVSLGLPFVIPGLEFLVEYLGPYRQFRGQGRFAWIFYYGWSLLLWYILYHKLKRWKGSWRVVWIGLAFLVLGTEAYFMSKASFIKPWTDEALYDRQKFEANPKYWFNNIGLLNYQAVLPMPYYHNGSENFLLDASGDAVRFTTILGWHYGMSNLGVNLSRTSFSQTLPAIQMGLLPYRPYQIKKILPSNKPLLVILDNAQYWSLAQKTSTLLRFSRVLHVDSLIQIRELPLEAFDLAVDTWQQEMVAAYHNALKTNIQRDGFLLPDSSYTFYYRTFDELRSPKKYQGKGAFVAKCKPWRQVPFLTFEAPSANNECAVWVYLGEDQRARMNFKGYEIDVAGNKKLVVHNACRVDLQALDNNGWGLVVFPINVSRPGAVVRMELECKDMNIKDLYIDEFLVRPVRGPQDHLYWRRGNDLIYNNLWFLNVLEN